MIRLALAVTLAVLVTTVTSPTAARAELRLPTRITQISTPRLTVDEVLAKLNTIYMTDLQRCYRKSLAREPAFAGKVILAFHVDADGIARSELGSASSFERCLTRSMGAWRFSSPSSASLRITLVLVSY